MISWRVPLLPHYFAAGLHKIRCRVFYFFETMTLPFGSVPTNVHPEFNNTSAYSKSVTRWPWASYRPWVTQVPLVPPDLFRRCVLYCQLCCIFLYCLLVFSIRFKVQVFLGSLEWFSHCFKQFFWQYAFVCRICYLYASTDKYLTVIHYQASVSRKYKSVVFGSFVHIHDATSFHFHYCVFSKVFAFTFFTISAQILPSLSQHLSKIS